MALKQLSADNVNFRIEWPQGPLHVQGPMSIFCWGSDTTGTQSQEALLATSGTSATNAGGNWWMAATNDGLGAGDNIEFIAVGWSGSPGYWACDTGLGGTFGSGAWHNFGVAYAYTSTSDVPVGYVDGQPVAFTNVGSTPAGTPTGAIGTAAPVILGAPGGGHNAAQSWAVEHAAWWNVVLTDAEWALLGAGVPPFLIRPDALIWYAPCLAGDGEGVNCFAYDYGLGQSGIGANLPGSDTLLSLPGPPMMPLTQEWFDRAIVAAAAAAVDGGYSSPIIRIRRSAWR